MGIHYADSRHKKRKLNKMCRIMHLVKDLTDSISSEFFKRTVDAARTLRS
jgi:hypothetical protein